MPRFVLLVCAFLLLIYWLDPYAPPVSLSGVGGLLEEPRHGTARADWPRGRSVIFETHLSADLTAQLSFVNQPIDYDLREDERLEVTWLGEGGGHDARLAFPVRRQTTVAPIVGERVRGRRVEGHAYHVRADADGLTVSNPDGSPTREKEARYVRWAWDVVGGAPALHEVLPAEGVVLGAPIEVDAHGAQRLLGLAIEEIVAEGMTLTLAAATADGTLRFEATARLAGAADLAGQSLALDAVLEGVLIADAASARLVELELSGEAHVSSEEGDGMAAEGHGPLRIRRTVSLEP